MKSLLLALLLSTIFIFSASTALAAPCTKDYSGSELCNPVERPGGFNGAPTPAATNIVQLATKIIYIVAGFATLLPIFAITYAGFAMVISQGNEEALIAAKSSLTWAVSGFVLAILSYVIVLATMQLIGANKLPDPLAPPSTLQNPLERDVFVEFLNGMLLRFFQFAGIAALLFVIISGFRYVTSAGNEEQAAQAKRGLTWSVAGIVTILLSYVIIKAAAAIFGIS